METKREEQLMPNAKDLKVTDGLSISLIGMPGSGKTYFALTALARYAGTSHVFVAPPAELNGYAGRDIEYTVLMDEGWRPSEGRFVATSYKTMMGALAALERRDNLRLVIVDTMSAGPNEAIWRDVMMAYGTDDTRTLGGNARQPYVTYASRFTELMDRLDLLRFRKHCHILLLWHEDVREAEGVGTARKETTKDATGMMKTVVHWDVGRLPEMRGTMRQAITKWNDLAFWTEPVVGANPHRCKLLVVPDATRAVKSRLPIVPALQKLGEVPNDFGKLLDLIERESK